jgi:dipeptidase
MNKAIASLFGLGLALMTGVLAAESSGTDLSCFAILVGKNASTDGSVLLAHNEDDGGEQFLNWYVVERQSHTAGDRVGLRRGGSLDQAPVTWKYLWLELPKMEVSDSFLNEHGVVIVSDGCPSREDRADYTDGGLLYELRLLAAERSTSALAAVELMGSLIERFGYADSGRTYAIADRTEAWVFCAVRGRHWVAARVPDDQVAAVANCYTLDTVDLSDTHNYRGAKDLVAYAKERGWYDPTRDGVFSFRRAYGSPASRRHPVNVQRQWAALGKLTGRRYAIDTDALPFVAAPKAGGIGLADLFAILADHYEGTEIDARKGKPEARGHIDGICQDGTQYGMVAQLRGQLPVAIGAVLWVAPYHPCSKVFVPWYAGMTKVPRKFSRFESAAVAREKHMTDVRDFRNHCPEHAYWKYVDSSDAISQDFPNRIAKASAHKAKVQRRILDRQAAFEAKAQRIQDQDRLAALLNEHTRKWLDQAGF